MSNFKKKTQQKAIPGTKTSLHNGQLITSSGNPSLDHIIGGGLTLGSIIMIEEDKFVTYSKVLAKYFLAEGLVSGHSIFVGSLDENTEDLIRKLPKPVDNPNLLEDRQSSSSKGIVSEEKDDMRIAWRYNELPKVNSEQITSNIGHHFNLTEFMGEEWLKNADITHFACSEMDRTGDSNIFTNNIYVELLQALSKLTNCDKFSKDSDQILRVCLTSFGSPLWYNDNLDTDFIKFLTILKSLVRNIQCVCLLTVPLHLIRILDERLIARVRSLVDFSIELESFAGSDKETNPAFKDYHGLFNIRKLTALNSLAPFTPETTDLAFKLRRKKFVIEKLHLPPELQEGDQANNEPSLGCGSSQKHLLEF